jgi:hypothetical protein
MQLAIRVLLLLLIFTYKVEAQLNTSEEIEKIRNQFRLISQGEIKGLKIALLTFHLQ